MRRTSAVYLLAGLVVPSALAQTGTTDPAPFIARYDVALGYSNIRANAPPADCGCFDMNGGFVSASYKLKYWLSAAAEVNGGHANNIGPLGQNLTLTTYTAGPRITFREGRVVPFVQALFGAAHGSDSYFPTGNTYTTSATSFALSTGGGLDFHLSHQLAIRPFEVQYLRTYLPNGSDDGQNHLLLGAGVVFKFRGRYARPHTHRPDPVPPSAPPEAVSAPSPPVAPVSSEPPVQRTETVQPPSQVVISPTQAPEPAVSHQSLQDAYFDYDSSNVRDDAQQAVSAVAAFLNAHPTAQVLIAGYSDERGSADYNFALGDRRAQASRSALIALGISSDRLQIVSYGEGSQVCDAQDETCWQRNRRTAFLVK